MYKHRRHFFVTWLLLCICIPIVGWIITFIVLLRRVRKDKSEGRSRFLYLENDTHDQTQIQRPDFHKETNIVALEEALFYMDVKDRRTLLLEILKKDYHPYTAFLRKAVDNEDTETAHYAASALTALHQKTLHDMQQRSNLYESNVVNLSFLFQFHKDLIHYLELCILEPSIETSLRQKSIQACMDLIMLGFAKKQYFMAIINEAIKLIDYELAHEYCDEMMRLFQEDEDALKMYIKCCYAQRKGKEMQEAIDKFLALKNRSNRTTQQVEYFSIGVSR